MPRASLAALYHSPEASYDKEPAPFNALFHMLRALATPISSRGVLVYERAAVKRATLVLNTFVLRERVTPASFTLRYGFS